MGLEWYFGFIFFLSYSDNGMYEGCVFQVLRNTCDHILWGLYRW
jgi:hypothetical protein